MLARIAAFRLATRGDVEVEFPSCIAAYGASSTTGSVHLKKAVKALDAAENQSRCVPPAQKNTDTPESCTST